MGSSSYSHVDHVARLTSRKMSGTPTFDYDDKIRTGKVAAKVHASLSPYGVGIRESRDSDAHPVTVPIGVVMDTTGSMASVPNILVERLSKLMGTFLDDKASGKRYLGDAYPAILIGAVDDYAAMGGGRTTVGFHGTSGGEGSLQVGQFESGIEIDDNLTNLWLTENGGGTYEESYDLALYFFARHTAHDAWDKRGRKGYLFLIGDEKTYPRVTVEAVRDVIGDNIGQDIATKDILAECQERYHVFFIIPRMTSHYGDPTLMKHWQDLLGQQNVLELDEPNQICELIAATVAINEEHVGIDDLKADSLGGSVTDALVKLGDAVRTGSLTKVSADSLPEVVGAASGEIERI